jgi:prefoldin subunit 5
VTTGAKIAIGCVLAFVLAGIAAMVALGGAAWWLKGKVESVAKDVAGDQERIDELHARANANAFERPADGTIQENQLVKFIGVRRRVYSVYEKHKAEIEQRTQKGSADLGDLTKGLSVLNELRLAQAQALADSGMSEDEYRFMVESVYKTLLASSMAGATGGQSVSEATEKGMEQTAEALRDSRKALEDAPPEVRDQMKALADQLEQSAEQARKGMEGLDVPPANLELFKKYEAEIKLYAMGGLELLGL